MTSIAKLVANVKPKAKIPRLFGLWSRPMQIMWLQQNQRKPKVRAR